MYIDLPLNKASFTLDISGVMGFFGGEETLSAMATVHLYRGRRWLVFSGTDMTTTGYLAYLTAQKAKEAKKTQEQISGGRIGSPGSVSIIDVDNVKLQQGDKVPTKEVYNALYAAIPITSSLTACLACAFVRDWLAFGLIVVGMVSSGLSCFVIGSGRLQFNLIKAAYHAPRGDGLLLTRNDVVILKGKEKDVTSITKAKFELKMNGGEEFHTVGVCSLLLLSQFFIQLLLVPRATLFGQIMFMSSLAVSWAYNSFLSSLEKEKIQTDLLWKSLDEPPITKLVLPNRASQAACANMFKKSAANFKPKKILERMIPNDTRVWEAWREHVAKQVSSKEKFKSFEPEKEFLADFEEEELELLREMLADAKHGWECYQNQLIA
ncbi:uncharacterized protein EDB91DRAFT_1330155 [Suillus paluster]|uniref:uncharacterized protein n=1 Tax=Suillus paluster TaxID=48578 RepID=UPI001B876A78|nr:uncharacterized protein EDB91DRAFT_1330155 [Suillus paluster]KAG1732874.1 hypothetical protein EDB91DRAFT_1330155 [Suillus paluster]